MKNFAAAADSSVRSTEGVNVCVCYVCVRVCGCMYCTVM